MPARLRAARLNQGLSIRDAAKQIDVSPETLRRAERGEGMRPANAKKIADFYGFRVTDIWPVPEDWDGSERRGTPREEAA